MGNIPSRDQIKSGTKVGIETKEDQGTGKLTEGIVKNLLTVSVTHPHGIKVELEGGQVGRVKKLLSESLYKSNTIKQITDSASKIDVSIPKDEDAWNEFKSTYRVDLVRFEKGDGKKIHNKEVEKEIPVTIAALANKEGGILFIGIDDGGKVLGLENDYELLKNPNDDKFQRMIWQTIQNYIKNMVYVSTLDMSLIDINSKKIGVIKIPSANEAIFVHDGNVQECYVRIGSKSEKFNPSEFMKYCKIRFK